MLKPKIFRRATVSVVCTALLALFASIAFGQTPGYTKLNVKGRVQLEIPSTWAISDAEQRKRVRDLAETTTGISARHIAALSVQSYPAPSRMFVRVSFLPLDPPITQAEAQQEVQSNKQQVLRDLEDTWRGEAATMWAGLAKVGIKEVGRPSVAVEPIGGKLAMVIRYGRTSTNNPMETMRVAQYHIPLGSEKALVTLSYLEGDQEITSAHDRLKSSIVIR
jgi:hypothetical protein